MISTMKYLCLFLFLVLGIALVGCGSSDDSDDSGSSFFALGGFESETAAAPAAARTELAFDTSNEAMEEEA